MFETIAAWDLAALTWLHHYVTYERALVGIWMSELASATAVIGVGGTVAILLTHARRFRDLAGLIVAAGGATLTAHALKLVTDRARPPFELASYLEAGSSFPSAHAATAVGLYGFLAWLVWRDCTTRRWWHWAAIVVAPILILLIGFSRVYLGVHYPGDVLAGYAVGAAFLYLGMRVSRRAHDKNLC